MPDNVPRLEHLIHKDLIDYVSSTFGEIVSWAAND